MKKITLLIACLICFNSIAQTKKARGMEFMMHFEENYNAKIYGKIYNRFSARFQKAVPKKRWDSIMNKMQDSVGLIKRFDFIEVSNTAIRFNVAFEKGHKRFKMYPDKSVLNKMDGFLYRSNPYFEKNISSFSLPFVDETWLVLKNGDPRFNHQKYAYNFGLVDDNGKLYQDNWKLNENYFGFDKEVIVPINAEVVAIVNGIKDNVPGTSNRFYHSGNSIILKTKNNEFLFFGHLKNKSIKVNEGDFVEKGEVLAKIGNTGSSNYPQLHFHVQNLESISVADGVKCYFDNILVNDKLKSNYSPVRGEKVKNK